MTNPEPTVTYTVKEMIAQLHTKVDAAISKIENVDARLAVQEIAAEQRSKRGEYRKWVIGLAVVLIAALIANVVH